MMNNSPSFSYDVLVVGAGPSGLTTAIAMARSGVRTLLIAVTILCVWLGHEANLAHNRIQMRQRLESSGAIVLLLDYDQFDHMMEVITSWRNSHPNEEIIDGALRSDDDGATSAFAQPSGLATDGKTLFVADS